MSPYPPRTRCIPAAYPPRTRCVPAAYPLRTQKGGPGEPYLGPSPGVPRSVPGAACPVPLPGRSPVGLRMPPPNGQGPRPLPVAGRRRV